MSDKKKEAFEDESFFFSKEKELVEHVKSRRDLRVIRGGKSEAPNGPQTMNPTLKFAGIIKKAA